MRRVSLAVGWGYRRETMAVARLMGTFRAPTGYRAEIHDGYGTAIWKGPVFVEPTDAYAAAVAEWRGRAR